MTYIIPLLLAVVLILAIAGYSAYRKGGDEALWWLCNIGVAVVAVTVYFIVTVKTEEPIIGFVLSVALVIGYLADAIKRDVKVDPPQAALRTLFEAPTNHVVEGGLRILPFHGAKLFGLTLVTDVALVNEDIPDVSFFTPDNVDGRVEKLAFSYEVNTSNGRLVPNSKGEMVVPFRNYIARGKRSGVYDYLSDRLKSAFERFMSSNEKGPANWIEARQLDNSGVYELLIVIAGKDAFSPIPSSVPTNLLMKYYAIEKDPFSDIELDDFVFDPLTRFSLQREIDAIPQPIPPVSKEESERIARESRKIKTRYVREAIEQAIRDDARGRYGVEAIAAGKLYESYLKEALNARHEEVLNFRTGQGCIDLDDLGIRLKKVVIGERHFNPEVVASAAQYVIEQNQRRKEAYETETRRLNALALVEGDPKGNLTMAEALRTGLIEAGKLPGSAHLSHEFSIKLDEGSQGLVEKLGPAAGVIAAKIIDGLGGTDTKKKKGGKGK